MAIACYAKITANTGGAVEIEQALLRLDEHLARLRNRYLVD